MTCHPELADDAEIASHPVGQQVDVAAEFLPAAIAAIEPACVGIVLAHRPLIRRQNALCTLIPEVRWAQLDILAVAVSYRPAYGVPREFLEAPEGLFQVEILRARGGVDE